MRDEGVEMRDQGGGVKDKCEGGRERGGSG